MFGWLCKRYMHQKPSKLCDVRYHGRCALSLHSPFPAYFFMYGLLFSLKRTFAILFRGCALASTCFLSLQVLFVLFIRPVVFFLKVSPWSFYFKTTAVIIILCKTLPDTISSRIKLLFQNHLFWVWLFIFRQEFSRICCWLSVRFHILNGFLFPVFFRLSFSLSVKTCEINKIQPLLWFDRFTQSFWFICIFICIRERCKILSMSCLL